LRSIFIPLSQQVNLLANWHKYTKSE
jgi:hypothetical protein